MNQEQARAAGWLGMRRMLGGSAFIFGCRVAGAALTLLTQILLARWMGASEFGIYVIAFSWCLLLATVTSLGLPIAAIRFIGLGIAQDRNAYIRGFVGRGSQLTVIASLLAAGLGIATVWQLPLGGSFRPAMTLALLALPAMSLLFFYSGVANSFSRFSLGFLPVNVLRPAIFCLLVLAAWSRRDALAAEVVMLLQLLAIATVSAGSLLAVRRYLAERVGSGAPEYDGRLWLRTAIPMLVTTLFSAYFAEISVILAGWFLPTEEVARFHVSFRLALLVNFGLVAVDAATAPDLARLYAAGDKRQVQQLLDRATRVRFVGALIAVGLFLAAGRWVLGWFGPEFVAAYPLLLILAGGQLVLAGVGPVARVLTITGQQDRALVVSVTALALAVVLIGAMTPLLGTAGAAAAAAVSLSIWALWLRRLLVRYTGFRPRLL
jgi:O-antigen/teichoic acid export membrane protein